MAVTKPFSVTLPNKIKVEVYVLQLADGRIIARTATELQTATDEERLAAGLAPLGS